MKKWNVKMLVEAAMMVALAFILSKIKVYQAPNGGSVTAGSMIPIILFALRWGLGPGIITGVSFGILKLIFGGWFFSIPQVILEYPIAFGVLGFAGILSNELVDLREFSYGKLVFSVFLAIGLRFLCHWFAGVIFFADTLPADISPFISSALYQASYLVPEFILSSIILALIWKPVSKIAR